jgi:hypothetical protein
MTHLKTLLATAAVSLLCSLPAHSTEAETLAYTGRTVLAQWSGCSVIADMLLSYRGIHNIHDFQNPCIDRTLTPGTRVIIVTLADGPSRTGPETYTDEDKHTWFCARAPGDTRCVWAPKAIFGSRSQTPFPQASAPTPPPPIKANEPIAQNPQARIPTSPPTLPAGQLEPLSWRIAQINQLMRQSLPIAVRHCGTDAAFRKEETAAVHALAAMEIVAAKAIRDPTTYTTAVATNDTINACLVMWRASESFASAMKCITDAAPTM